MLGNGCGMVVVLNVYVDVVDLRALAHKCSGRDQIGRLGVRWMEAVLANEKIIQINMKSLRRGYDTKRK